MPKFKFLNKLPKGSALKRAGDAVYDHWFGGGDETQQSSTTIERSRTALLVFSLVICSGAAGSALGARALLTPTRHFRVNPIVSTSLSGRLVPNVDPSLASAASAARRIGAHAAITPADTQGLQTATALNSLNIDQLIKQNQVSIDDRAGIHTLIQGVATTEVTHYNILNDRLNVDDARVMTIGWILGILFTLSQAIVVFFHLDRRRTLNRRLESNPYQYEPQQPPVYQPPPPVPFQGTLQIPQVPFPAPPPPAPKPAPHRKPAKRS